MKFGEALVDYFVSFVFGNGIHALRGVVLEHREDYLVVRAEQYGDIIHVPLSSIVYVKIGAKQEV